MKYSNTPSSCPKIIILILSSNNDDYPELIKTVKETWANSHPENIDIYYNYGGSPEFKVINNEIHCNTPEGRINLGRKTLQAFEYLYNNKNFDYLFRTNAGSYIDHNNLLEFIKNKPRNKFYCGIIGHYGGVNYASGSGYFLSKDLMKIALDNKDSWDHNYIDDVSLGQILYRNNIKVDPRATRLSIYSEYYENGFHKRYKYQEGDKEVPPSKISNKIYHYRLRSNYRKEDAEEIKRLHQQLK